MNKVLMSSVTDSDFLTMVIDVLVSEDKLSSADAVREIGRLLQGEEGRKIITSHNLTKLQYLDLIK